MQSGGRVRSFRSTLEKISRQFDLIQAPRRKSAYIKPRTRLILYRNIIQCQLRDPQGVGVSILGKQNLRHLGAKLCSVG